MQPSQSLRFLSPGFVADVQRRLSADRTAEEALDALQGSILAHESLSAAARRQAIAALESDRKALGDARLADLAAELTAACRELGLRAEIRVARRKPRRKARRAELAVDATGESAEDTNSLDGGGGERS